MLLRSRSWAVPVIGAVLLALLIIILRLTLDARAALKLGDARREAGALPEAISHYFDAARAAYPGNWYADQALDRLWLLGEATQPDQPALYAPGNEQRAVSRQALETFRTALLATRSFYVPRAADLESANKRLADIYARWESRDPRYPASTVEARRQWHLQKLSVVPGPKLLWVVTALIGLAMWLGAVAAFIVKAITPNMKLKRGPALGAALAFGFGFGLFLLGLSQ